MAVVDNTVELLKLGLDIVTTPVYKSVQASADFSQALRQGFKTLVRDYKLWKESIFEAFRPFQKMRSVEEQNQVKRLFRAKVISDPLYEEMTRSKLAIGGLKEDYFPTAIAEKIPALGRIFQGSNDSFTIFAQSNRMGLYKTMRQMAIDNGTELSPDLLKGFAKVANSMSGRGDLGKYEASSGSLNKIFFSIRFMKAQVDTFLMPFDTSLPPLARQEAFKTSAATIGGISALVYGTSLVADVELDPRSSKFGRVRVGSSNNYLDLTTGLGGYITFLVRTAPALIPGIDPAVKTSSGRIVKLNTDTFGSQTAFDVAMNFFTGKLAPGPSTTAQALRGRDYSGNKPELFAPPSLPGVGDGYTPPVYQTLITPISWDNILVALDEKEEGAIIFITALGELLGLGASKFGK
jgi:hypothetical protein